MRVVLAILLAALASASAEWRIASPGWKYTFPADHGSHVSFKTEWWYFTGSLRTAEGREFGYQLTFFRQGVRPPDEDIIPLSRFVTKDLKFAHFAITDIAGNSFAFHQKTSRGAFGEAGFDDGSRLAFIEDWELSLDQDGTFHLKARMNGDFLDLALTSVRPPVIHGENGISRKGSGEDNASHYYSLTHLETTGMLETKSGKYSVSGLSWFDHEWATNQLGENQVGWDWLSLHLDDGSELMVFQLRDRDGSRDPHSSGTFINSKGEAFALSVKDFEWEPLETWTSEATGGKYPVKWKLSIPRINLSAEIRAAVDDQELKLQPITYWEGAVRASGTSAGKVINGSGYLEMTGYAGKIVGLQEKMLSK